MAEPKKPTSDKWFWIGLAAVIIITVAAVLIWYFFFRSKTEDQGPAAPLTITPTVNQPARVPGPTVNQPTRAPAPTGFTPTSGGPTGFTPPAGAPTDFTPPAGGGGGGAPTVFTPPALPPATPPPDWPRSTLPLTLIDIGQISGDFGLASDQVTYPSTNRLYQNGSITVNRWGIPTGCTHLIILGRLFRITSIGGFNIYGFFVDSTGNRIATTPFPNRVDNIQNLTCMSVTVTNPNGLNVRTCSPAPCSYDITGMPGQGVCEFKSQDTNGVVSWRCSVAPRFTENERVVYDNSQTQPIIGTSPVQSSERIIVAPGQITQQGRFNSKTISHVRIDDPPINPNIMKITSISTNEIIGYFVDVYDDRLPVQPFSADTNLIEVTFGTLIPVQRLTTPGPTSISPSPSLIGSPGPTPFGPPSSQYDTSFTSFTFTPCGATGKNGPTLAQIKSQYASQPWANNWISLYNNRNGYQQFVVQVTGTYRITVAGASGGKNAQHPSGTLIPGGKGAIIKGDVNLTQGDVLILVVGQKGTDSTGRITMAGGGGGSHVIKIADIDEAIVNSGHLLSAGGGSGAFACQNAGCPTSPLTPSGCDAWLETTANSPTSIDTNFAGTNGREYGYIVGTSGVGGSGFNRGLDGGFSGGGRGSGNAAGCGGGYLGGNDSNYPFSFGGLSKAGLSIVNKVFNSGSVDDGNGYITLSLNPQTPSPAITPISTDGLIVNMQAKDLENGFVRSWGGFVNNNAIGKPLCYSNATVGNGKYVQFRADNTTYLYQTLNPFNINNGITIAFLANFRLVQTPLERLLQGVQLSGGEIFDIITINRAQENPRNKLTFKFNESGYLTPADNVNQDIWYVWTFRYGMPASSSPSPAGSTPSGANICTITRSTTGAGFSTTTLVNSEVSAILRAPVPTILCLGANNSGSTDLTQPPASQQYGNFDLGAFLMYNRALTNQELSNVRTYLALGNSC